MDDGTHPGRTGPGDEGALTGTPQGAAPIAAHFRFHATTADYLRVVSYLSRRSIASVALSAFVTGNGIVLIVTGYPIGVLFALLGIGIFGGLLSLPFTFLVIRRRADLLLADVEVDADATGLTMSNQLASSNQTWPVYRRTRETGSAFLLQPGTGATVFVLKRGADPDQIAGFRRVLDAVGLRPSGTAILPLLIAALVGAALSVALVFGQRALATIGTNATISMQTLIDDSRKVLVLGSSDLPDGTVVAVELIQLDEYDRAVVAGARPEPGISPWILVDYATVRAGVFSSTFTAPTWPRGRAEAVAFFWMTPDQPTAARIRFGSDGASLQGPDVFDTPDHGRMLQVVSDFTLP